MAALRKELKMEAKNTEYKPLGGGMLKKGRRYLVAGKTIEEVVQEQQEEDTPFQQHSQHLINSSNIVSC